MPLRTQIAMELRSHIAERLERGHTLDDVLRQLGDPTTLAESYLWAVPLVSAPFGSRGVAKLIDVLAILAVVVAVAWVVSRLVPEGFGPPVAILLGVGRRQLVFGLYTDRASTVGATLGKRRRACAWSARSGARIGLGQAIVRQLPMFLQVYWIDVMFALFTDKSQRAFELLSKTRVVRA